jgi:lipopolysaccharide export system permease protein
MTILDRYLFRMFLRSYVMFFLSMLGLYVMIDLFANIDEFGKESAAGSSLFSRIVRYYAVHTFDYFGRLSPIITQMAAMYTLADLRRHNELTPILAAGVPTRRAIAPILFGVLAVISLGVANREIAMPFYSEFLQRGHDDVDGANQLTVGSRIDSDTMLVRAERALREGQRLFEVKITLPDLQEVTAEQAAFVKGPQGKPGILLEKPKPDDLRETEKLKRVEGGKVFVATSLTFGEMVRSNGWTRFASGSELIEELGKPQASNPQEIRAMIHNRIMQPIANVVLVLIGIPFVLQWERKKFFVSLLISMLLSAGYFVLDAVSTYLAGFGYFDPMFAAWLPIFIFLPVATSLSHKIGT